MRAFVFFCVLSGWRVLFVARGCVSFALVSWWLMCVVCCLSIGVACP